MGFKILLVNPNRFKNPPIIPIGLEYIVTALEKYDHNVDILDLCFCESPEEELAKALFKKSYDIVGFSIRNIDSLGYFNNEFFLPSIKPLVQCVKEHNIPILLGGSGFSAMPYEILDYFNADYGIIGPSETIFPLFLELLQSKQLTKKIFDGWQCSPDLELIHLRAKKFDYAKYLSVTESVGFETHKGCLGQCPYCVNANTQIWYNNIQNIIEELRYIVKQGYTHFQLCDDEFNSDLNFSIKFSRALIKANLPLKWKLFMKPYPYNKELFRLLHETNAYRISIIVTSDTKIQDLNNYSYHDLENIVNYCKEYEIELAIDLMVGYPYESLESVKNMINFFKNHRPTTITVDSYFRVYEHTELAKLVRNDNFLQKNLIKPYSEELNFLEPVFYNQFSQSVIEELISDDNLFRIAWLTPELDCQQI
ncbi:MAG: B12-binding domain-containing radical SAM protein, partial [Candidatus Hodarchaeota archaeon]